MKRIKFTAVAMACMSGVAVASAHTYYPSGYGYEAPVLGWKAPFQCATYGYRYPASYPTATQLYYPTTIYTNTPFVGVRSFPPIEFRERDYLHYN